jgi:Ni,Fe-hydrogenase maturation factor
MDLSPEVEAAIPEAVLKIRELIKELYYY